MKELQDSISTVETLAGMVVKPYGSFVSNLYAVSGDLDISVELLHNLDSPRERTTKWKKQEVLKDVKKALETEGIAGVVHFVPEARVPILQYVSKKFGIPCDISVDNYPGLIKSRVFYWINKLDERFGDMVLLVKEWAKSQEINNPKSKTLNSYSLCLLVVFHFQTCKPAILPPLKEIYDLNIEDTTEYSKEDVDKMCQANIAQFQSKNTNQRNQSSLSHLFATFFQKIPVVISTFEGRFMENQNIQHSPFKSISPLLLADPFERHSNAARTVSVDTIDQVTSAFRRAKSVLVLDGRVADRNELLSLMCTTQVGKMLGVTAVALPDTSPAVDQFLQHIQQEELVEEQDHLHHPRDDLAPMFRFLHIRAEVAEDDD